MNPLLEAYLGSDLFGKAIFLSLLALSIITWVIFLQKSALHRSLRRLGDFQKNSLNLDLKPANHPFGHIAATLNPFLQRQKPFSPGDSDYLKAHLQKSVSAEIACLEKGLPWLATIISLAPFLGLLGTVWGSLLTLAELQTGVSASASTAVMGGLSMALGTTVFGIVVAIPALIAYNSLRASIRHLSQEMEDFSHLLLASVEQRFRK